MVQLINFIPGTVDKCRSLLLKLRDNADGITLTDNYGHTAELTAEQERELALLVERQIGEKTPAAPKPQAEQKKKEDRKTAKK